MFIASSVKLCPSSVRSDMNVVSGNPALYLFNESKTITSHPVLRASPPQTKPNALDHSLLDRQ